MEFSKVTHVIFDLDGLLLDTEPLYEKAFEDTLTIYGSKLTQDVRVKFLGTSERKSCEICVEEFKLKCSVDEFEKVMTEMFHNIASTAKLLPGAEKILRHLSKNNVPICVASGSAGPGVKLKMMNHLELFKVFHHIITGGTDPEVKRPKPNPDIFFVAASRFDNPPEPEHVSFYINFLLKLTKIPIS